MRIRSTFLRSARSCFPLALSGLVIHGSIRITFPEGVTSRNAAWPYQVSWDLAAPATCGGTEDDAVWAAATSEVEQSRTVRTRARGRFTVRFLQCRETARTPHNRPGPPQARSTWHEASERARRDSQGTRFPLSVAVLARGLLCSSSGGLER